MRLVGPHCCRDCTFDRGILAPAYSKPFELSSDIALSPALEEIWVHVAEDASPATVDQLVEAIIDGFEFLG
jgi:hypothetical protein